MADKTSQGNAAALVAVVMALTACTPDAPDACGAAGLQDLIGQDAAVLAAMTFPAGTRFIEPGTPVTRDLRPDRLNVFFGMDGRIEKISCG